VSSIRAPLTTQVTVEPSSDWWPSWRLLNLMHFLALSKKPIRGMTKGRKLSMRSLVPPFPLPRSRRMSSKIHRRGSDSSTHRCWWRFSVAVHCWQWEQKEPHFSRGLEAVGATDYTTPATIHHQVDSSRARSTCQPTMSPSLQQQVLHRWGTVWC